MSTYEDALKACHWLNENSETHRVLNCKGDRGHDRHDIWYVTVLGTTDGRYTNASQLTTLAKSQGWEG